MFKKAVKYEAKGRVALVGPAGSGKSWTGLILARALVGPQGKIAAIDTEHGSLSKYADQFDFDVVELDSFSPENFMKALKAAEDAGYNAFMCDSLSHFWTGKDGALEFVDMAAKRHRDGMGGWKEFRPHERAMVDAMIASPMHIIVAMRTKTEYQEITVDGKKKRVKVGLAPVQREGLEYEFDLVGYMDDENTLVVDKTRCPAYTGKAITKPGLKDFQPFVEWLKGTTKPPLITQAQGEALAAAAKAKGVKIGAVAVKAGVMRLGEITADQFHELMKWIELQTLPKEVDRAYDTVCERLIKAGVANADLADYVESLTEMSRPSITDHLTKLADAYKLEMLPQVFLNKAEEVRKNKTAA